MIDEKVIRKILDYKCFELTLGDSEDENGDLLDCIKTEKSPIMSTHFVICQRRNVLTRARSNSPWTNACQGDKFDQNYFVVSSDDEYILTKVVKSTKKSNIFIMKQHFDREKRCWVNFQDPLAVNQNSIPIGIKISFKPNEFHLKSFEKQNISGSKKQLSVLDGKGEITFFKNSAFIDKADDHSILKAPQTSTPKKRSEPIAYSQNQSPTGMSELDSSSQKPSESQPSESQPSESQPSQAQPSQSQPSQAQSSQSQPEKTYFSAMAALLRQESLPINFHLDEEIGKIVPKPGGIQLKYDPNYNRKQLLIDTHRAELDNKFLTNIRKGAFRKELTKNPQKYQLIKLSDDQEKANRKNFQLANDDQFDYKFLEIIQVQPDKENEIYNPITGNQFYDHPKCSILKNIFSMFPSPEEHILILRNI